MGPHRPCHVSSSGNLKGSVMRIRAIVASLIRNLFSKREVEDELDDELRFYVDELTDRKVRNGENRALARRNALLETGGVEQIKEDVRNERIGFALETLEGEIRQSVVGLWHAPKFA